MPPSPVSRVDRQGQEHFYPLELPQESAAHAAFEHRRSEPAVIAAKPPLFGKLQATWAILASVVMAMILVWYFL